MGKSSLATVLAEEWRRAIELYERSMAVGHELGIGRTEAISRFNLGLIDLRQRARGERLFWQIAGRLSRILPDLSYVPDEFENLDRTLADTYFCNFSVFQSMPDSWAVDQLFPVVPIHRLNEEPTRRAILADITCDSDGKVDRFIDLHDVKDVLELHPLRDEPYYLGVFLVGAYQEILGDLHNLFGDTNTVFVRSTDEPGGYSLDAVVEGDSVSDVLDYVQYDRKELTRQMRRSCEKALRAKRMTLEETARFMAMFVAGLDGYTYLE